MVNITNKTEMKLGTTVKFKYDNNVVIGIVIDKRGVNYLIDVATIDDIKQTHKTVITVTASAVINYLLNKDSNASN